MLLGALVLAAFVVYRGSLAGLSWLVVIVAASIAGLLVVRDALRGAEEPEVAERPGGIGAETPGELRSLADAIGRGRSGSAYSQAVVSARVAAAFLEKVRLARGLSLQELEKARADPAAVRRLIGDPELVDFVLQHERYNREWPKEPAALESEQGFGPFLTRVLDSMEAWS